MAHHSIVELCFNVWFRNFSHGVYKHLVSDSDIQIQITDGAYQSITSRQIEDASRPIGPFHLRIAQQSSDSFSDFTGELLEHFSVKAIRESSTPHDVSVNSLDSNINIKTFECEVILVNCHCSYL